MEMLLKIIQEDNKYKDVSNSQFPVLQEDNKSQNLIAIITPTLKIIECEINTIFFKNIKNSKTVDEAQEYFDILEKVQSIIAGLFFKEKIKLSNILRRFVADCDRLDDPWLRKNLYERIRKGKYK